MTYRARCFLFLFFFIFTFHNSLYSELCQSTCFEKRKSTRKSKALHTGTVPYIIHNSQKERQIHTRRVIITHTHTHIKHTHTYDNLYTLAELSFHKKKNWLSESPPCVFDSLYKEKCKGGKKKREQGVTVDKFWNVSKNNFSYGVVKTMLNVHKI